MKYIFIINLLGNTNSDASLGRHRLLWSKLREYIIWYGHACGYGRLSADRGDGVYIFRNNLHVCYYYMVRYCYTFKFRGQCRSVIWILHYKWSSYVADLFF